MALCSIERISVLDRRYSLPSGAGSDAVHTNPEYCPAVTRLEAGSAHSGTGFALTLAEGNRLVREAIQLPVKPLQGRPIEDLMAEFGAVARQLADDPMLRWLGPHKGAVHLALASITNACFDLWAKSRGVPLWKLLLDLSPKEVVQLLDLSYLEETLSDCEAADLLRSHLNTRSQRKTILQHGYPGYDTSVGWIAYDDDSAPGPLQSHCDGP